MKKVSANKKIVNAQSIEYEGIVFRSIAERNVYKKLVSLGITPEYEPDTFVLWEGFTPLKEWYLEGEPVNTKKQDKVTGKRTKLSDKPKSFENWKYTPDFKIQSGKNTFYIEVKGYPNDLWPYKRKLFLKLLESLPNVYFFEVKTIKGLLKSVNTMSKINETP